MEKIWKFKYNNKTVEIESDNRDYAVIMAMKKLKCKKYQLKACGFKVEGVIENENNK